jgi:hypothetical protein
MLQLMGYTFTDLTDITCMLFEDVKWMNMNQDLVQWRAALKAVLKIGMP